MMVLDAPDDDIPIPNGTKEKVFKIEEEDGYFAWIPKNPAEACGEGFFFSSMKKEMGRDTYCLSEFCFFLNKANFFIIFAATFEEENIRKILESFLAKHSESSISDLADLWEWVNTRMHRAPKIKPKYDSVQGLVWK